MLYFLNDVEEGGETAFPVANNATFSVEVSIALLLATKLPTLKGHNCYEEEYSNVSFR